jgi:transcriptional regulator with XRE-family HTH domain
MKTLNNKLKKIIGKKLLTKETNISFDLKSKKWLRYSSNISRRILSSLEDDANLNQIILAKQIGVSPQYISKVLKGQQNLSLETIAKLSEALKVELIIFPEYKYSAPKNIAISYHFINDDEVVFFNVKTENNFIKKSIDHKVDKEVLQYKNMLSISKKYTDSLECINILAEEINSYPS